VPNAGQLDYFTTILLIMTFMLIIYTIVIIMAQRRDTRREAEQKIIARVSCEKNDYSEERDFKKGYYIGLEVGKCPNCGSRLFIESIYVTVESLSSRQKTGVQPAT